MSTAEQQPIRDLPGLGPAAHARWRSSELGATTERLQRQLILSLVGDVRGCRVVDVGCGHGEPAVEPAKRGAAVTGIDASAAMIDAAQGRAGQQGADIAFQVAMAEEIPFPSEQFGIVTAITILCFVDVPAPVFGAIARVLRPAARFDLAIGRHTTAGAAFPALSARKPGYKA